MYANLFSFLIGRFNGPSIFLSRANSGTCVVGQTGFSPWTIFMNIPKQGFAFFWGPMQNHCAVKVLVLQIIIIRQPFSSCGVFALNDSGFVIQVHFRDKSGIAIIVYNNDFMFRIKCSDTSITLLPILIRLFVVYVAQNNKSRFRHMVYTIRLSINFAYFHMYPIPEE